MQSQKLVPNNMKILSGSALKVIAMVTMVIDHVGGHLADHSIVLFSLGNYQIRPFLLMRIIGRMAFPIFAFLLAEGFFHTRSRLKYGVSLLVFALISEIPWNLEHGGNWFHPSTQNVFFTLLLGFLGMCAAEYLKKEPALMLVGILLFGVLADTLRADYGFKGYVFIMLMYALREHEVLRILPSALLAQPWFSMTAFIPISLYNGKRGFIKGKVLKYTFYAIYPVHIFVIYLLKYVI